MQILQYIFSSFWIWLGCVILIYILGMVITTFVGTIISSIRGDDVEIKSSYILGDYEYSSTRHGAEAEEDLPQ